MFFSVDLSNWFSLVKLLRLSVDFDLLILNRQTHALREHKQHYRHSIYTPPSLEARYVSRQDPHRYCRVWNIQSLVGNHWSLKNKTVMNSLTVSKIWLNGSSSWVNRLTWRHSDRRQGCITYVLFAVPFDQQRWPTKAACWSPSTLTIVDGLLELLKFYQLAYSAYWDSGKRTVRNGSKYGCWWFDFRQNVFRYSEESNDTLIMIPHRFSEIILLTQISIPL